MTVSEPVARRARGQRPVPPTSAARRDGASDVDDGMMGVALLAGPANVIMQLARPGVGYGVMESRVESGRVDRHPIKRARTTFTYLAVATRGSDEQKAAFRRAVNGRTRRCTRPTTARSSTTPSTRICSCGWRPASTRASSTCTGIFVGEMDERDRRPALPRRHGAGHDAAGARRRCGRPTAAAFDRYWQESLEQGAHRRHGPRVPVPDRGVADARRPAAGADRSGPTNGWRC